MDNTDDPGNRDPSVLEGACPSAAALHRVAGKWSLPAIAALRAGPLRNHALMRALPGISPKVLAQTLRELEADGLVTRTEFASAVRHVEYALTDAGQALSAALVPVDRWARERAATGGHAR